MLTRTVWAALATLTVAALTAAYLWAINGAHADRWDEYEVQP